MSIASDQETIASLMGELATPAGQADPYPVYARMRELATARALSSAFQTFAALATAGLALVISQLAIGRAGGYRDFAGGMSVALFVPGARWRYLRRPAGHRLALATPPAVAARCHRLADRHYGHDHL
jgi:hypothetical protein